jgi:antibiotic biosynthesis monooxygenase (ABM) superfamily enzyme
MMNSAKNDTAVGISNQQNVSAGLTVVVNRRIKPGREVEFEQAMRSFVQFALDFPGHRGINILRPAAGGRDYIVVDRFSDEAARCSFKTSPEYREWMNQLGELTEGDPRIEELSGLEGWFTLPEDAGLAKPPKYKMAIATFLGVFPVAMLLNLGLGPVIRSWNFLLSNAVFNACVVILLTWVVMPLLTRALHRWLFPT